MGLLAMAEDNPFDVIRDAIFSAHVDHAHTGDAGLTCDPVYEAMLTSMLVRCCSRSFGIFLNRRTRRNRPGALAA
jgi:hypothetical protein